MKLSAPPEGSRYPQPIIITREEERELISAAQAGDHEAEAYLHQAHMPFAVAMVKRYSRNGRYSGAPQDDLNQIAAIGLLLAIRKFDLAKHKTRLITYASSWIRAGLFRYIEENFSLLRPPQNVRFRQAFDNSTAIEKLYGHMTDEQAAAAFNADRNLKIKLTAQDIKELRDIKRNGVLSLYGGAHKSDSEEGLPELVFDTVVDKRPPADEQVIKEQLIDELYSVIRHKLTLRERFVVDNFMLKEKGDRPTLQMIGDCLRLTRQRVQQIEQEIIAKLKAHFQELEDDDTY